MQAIFLKSEKSSLPTNSSSFRISNEVLAKWAYAKGRKNEPRRKTAAVTAFIKNALGSSGLAKSDLVKAAKQMPIQLSMDNAFNFTFGDKTVSVSLAREEINYRIAVALNLKDATFDRPNAVTRKQIEQALASKEIWSKVEASAITIATDRAVSLLGLKDKDLFKQVASRIRPQAVKSITELIKKDKPAEFSISGKLLKVDRDTLAANSFAYGYKEGGLPFPDHVNGPGRTIITSEGGASVSRFKHVICETCASGSNQHKAQVDCINEGKLRRLYPEELERMNGFSAEHSQKCRELKISDGKRAFFMGNALVVCVARTIMKSLSKSANGRSK